MASGNIDVTIHIAKDQFGCPVGYSPAGVSPWGASRVAGKIDHWFDMSHTMTEREARQVADNLLISRIWSDSRLVYASDDAEVTASEADSIATMVHYLVGPQEPQAVHAAPEPKRAKPALAGLGVEQGGNYRGPGWCDRA
jgi:hypothetical protein